MSAPNGDAQNAPPRKRSLTSVTLGWIAERVRKAEKIKEAIASGTYKVDPDKVARSILNEDDEAVPEATQPPQG